MTKNYIIFFAILWAVFSGIFTLNGVKYRNPNNIIAGMHYMIGVIIVIYFVINMVHNNNYVKKIKEVKYLYGLMLTVILSTLLNSSSLFDSIRFVLMLLPPILLYLILVYDNSINSKAITKAFNIFILICVLQVIIAIYKNLNELISGVIIIDDYFRGTMGAYHFVFLLNLYTIYLINKFMNSGKLNIAETILGLLFPLTFIISGAGGYLLIFATTQLINLIILCYRYNLLLKLRLILPILIIITVIFIITNYFYLNYSLSGIIISKFFSSDTSILNNPKVALTLSALKPVWNFPSMIIGLGPGQYLSGIGDNPDAYYFGSILLDQMGSSAFAVNSDILSIFSELGFVGVIIFYLLITSSVKHVQENAITQNQLILRGTISGVIWYALLLSLQYRIFMFFVPSYIFWFYLGMLKRRIILDV